MTRVPSRQPVVAGERFPKTRAAVRYPLRALAEVIEPVGRRTVSGWTSNISLEGCCVRVADPLVAGTIVKLKVQHSHRTFETWARVADSVPEEAMGLAFIDTGEAQRDLLKKWFADADVENKSSAV
jgi:hypothetical protein